MDENKKNPRNESEQLSVDSSKKIDKFFSKLEQNGVLEDSVNSKHRSDGEYDPDYIDLGDYEKSDTGYVSLKEKSGEVKTFNSASKAAAQQAASKNAAQAGKGKKSLDKAASGNTPSSSKNAKKSKVEEEYKPRHKWWRRLGKIVLCLFCIGTIAVCVVAVAAAMYLAKVTADDDEVLDLNSLKLSYATRLMAFDKTKEEWYEYERIFGDENRVWVNYEEFPKELIDVTISSEDQRFMSHKGVDLKRTIFAFINEYVFKMSDNTQGGSTITQQLIKNITDEKGAVGFDGALRKLREIYRAYMLERQYSKEQILEAYLNTFRLGGQVAGIEAAANYYFGKSTKDLTTAESAAIVCITKYPVQYDPFSYPETNRKQREDVVLYGMKEQGFLSEADYKSALAESKTFSFTQPGGTSTTSSDDIYSYFTDTTVREVMKDLEEINGLTKDEAYKEFYGTNEGGGGLTVYLTMDPFIQETVEDIAFNPIYWDRETYTSYADKQNLIWPALEYEYQKDENDAFVLDEDGNKIEVLAKNQIQAAMVVMNYNGELLGVTGGIRQKEGSLSLNRAVDSVRQTGSSMKPIAAFAPALEIDKITFSTLFADAPVETVDGQPWPRNYSRTYGGAVTVYEGIARSLNTTAAAAIKLIGPDYAYDFLTTSLGITSLPDNEETSWGTVVTDRTMSLALGGLSYGVSPYEMAAAYQVFGNDGTYTTPHCYTKVTNARDVVILDKTKNCQTIKALSDESAMIMNRLLQGVVSGDVSGATGTYMRTGSKLPIAAKTGTSSEDNDFWAIGLNPYYVMAVWEGYDQKANLPNLRPHPTQKAFNEVMNRISEDLEYKAFPIAEGVVAMGYCPSTGYLAGSGCPTSKTGYYKKDNIPRYCGHEYVPTAEEAAAAAAAAAAA